MTEELISFWDKLVTGRISFDERKLILEKVYGIALSVVKLKINANGKNTVPFTSLEDLAIESTVFLFTASNSNVIRIIHYMKRYENHIGNHLEFNYYLYKTITETVEKILEFNYLKWDLIEFPGSMNSEDI